MVIKRGTWVVMECWKETCRLAGRHFENGDRIAVKLSRNLITDGKEDHDGAWGWGRYSGERVLDFAAQVEDLRDFEIFWEARTEKVELASAVLL